MIKFRDANGDPQALQFIMDCYFHHNAFDAEQGLERLKRAGIPPHDWYNFWHVYCKDDTDLAITLMNTLTIDEIKEKIYVSNTNNGQ